MSGVSPESRLVGTRSASVPPLTVLSAVVLGVGLIVAGLHGGATTSPRAAATTYRPPAAVAAAAPAADVHTMSGVAPRPATARAARPKAGPRRVPARVTPRPATAVRAARPAPTSVRRTTTAATSFRQELDAAIARIPTYRAGAAQWVVSRAYAFWGTADWYHDVLYVSPDVPTSKLYDVAVHEWSHELSVLDYGGDVARATAAMNAWFGGSDLTGPERAADCMSILQGARWTHYTTCADARWRLGATRLIAGRPL
jgi:hypothetical protein